MATPTLGASAQPTFTRQEKVFTLTGTLLGLLLAALDQTIVSTAGPQIQRDLNIDPSLYTWITTSYLVASTVMVPIYGKLSDLFGRRAILLVGVALFLLGSLLCGFSQTTLQLIAFRAVQGLGSAALFTTAFAVVSDLFSPAERGRYTGLFGAVFGLSSVLGPLLGGFLTDNFGWHWVFFVNLPVGAVALLFIITRMPPLKHLYGQSEQRPRIDYLGAFWLAVGVIPLLFGLSLGKSTLTPGETGFLWTSWQILAMFAVAAVGIAVFLWVERRAPDPLMKLSLFKNRVFSVGTLATFVLGMAFLGPIIFLPLFMVNVVGLSATNSGLTITPLALALVAGNILSGQLVSRIGKYKPIMLTSLVLLAVAFVVMGLTLTPDSTQLSVTLKMILVGLGLGPSIPLYTLAIQNAADPRLTGQVTSSVTFFRNLGQVVGVALLGTIFANTLTQQLHLARANARAELPAGARAQFDRLGAGGGGAAAGTFDLKQVKRGVRQQLEDQKVTLQKALGNNDPAAVNKLLASDQTPQPLRDTLQQGGVGAAVKAKFAAQKRLATDALQNGDPAAIGKLLSDPNTPAPLRALLQQGGAGADVKARALGATLQGLTRAEPGAVRAAKASAVSGATGAIDDLEPKVMRALDTFGAGFKAGMTLAVEQVFRWGLILVVLAFLTTVFLPQLTLRKRGETVAPPVE